MNFIKCASNNDTYGHEILEKEKEFPDFSSIIQWISSYHLRRALLRFYAIICYRTRLTSVESLNLILIGSIKGIPTNEMHHILEERKNITSESETKWNRTHQLGGTSTIIREPLNNAIIESGSDLHKLGRWSYCTIRGKKC